MEIPIARLLTAYQYYITVGRRNAPVIGSGIFVGGYVLAEINENYYTHQAIIEEVKKFR